MDIWQVLSFGSFESLVKWSYVWVFSLLLLILSSFFFLYYASLILFVVDVWRQLRLKRGLDLEDFEGWWSSVHSWALYFLAMFVLLPQPGCLSGLERRRFSILFVISSGFLGGTGFTSFVLTFRSATILYRRNNLRDTPPMWEEFAP